jgi:hypothetical protein
LTGKDSSILTYLAQYPNIPKRDREKAFGQLKGDALQVARALTGVNPRPTKKIRGIADELRAWAKDVK